MTDLTDEAVKALLDGATPGPWRADGPPYNRIVWSSNENRVCFMAHSNGLDDARDVATSNLAAAAPDLARTALDALARLGDAEAQVGALTAERDEAKRLMEMRHREMLAADKLMRKYQREAEADRVVAATLRTRLAAALHIDKIAALVEAGQAAAAQLRHASDVASTPGYASRLLQVAEQLSETLAAFRGDATGGEVG